MAGKNRMPPELLEHFKSKAQEKDSTSETKEEKQESDKTKRKEAVTKARVRLESKNSRKSDDQEEETR